MKNALSYILIALLFICIALARMDTKDVVLSFSWDKYDLSLPENKGVTHLQIWQLKPEPVRLFLDNIEPTSTSVEVKHKADGRTYVFAMRACTEDTFSVFSNSCAVTLPYEPIPLSVKNFFVKIISERSSEEESEK